MNYPVGELVEQGIALEQFKLLPKLGELNSLDFDGYIVLTIDGIAGIEEGVLFLRKGVAVGAAYEYLKFGKTVFGEEALRRFLNAYKARQGILDVCKLSRQQVDLIIAFDERIALEQRLAAKDLSKLTPKEYNSSLAESALGNLLESRESKQALFKRFGLGAIRE